VGWQAANLTIDELLRRQSGVIRIRAASSWHRL
jgi:hypothetical protein